MSQRYIYSFTEPIEPDALRALLRQTGWADRRRPLEIQRMLDNSLITLGVWHDERLIAFSRVITDDCFRALIDDVVVDSAYRGMGIGSAMMKKLLLRTQHIEIVMLDCATDTAPFYERFGFEVKVGRSMELRNARQEAT